MSSVTKVEILVTDVSHAIPHPHYKSGCCQKRIIQISLDKAQKPGSLNFGM